LSDRDVLLELVRGAAAAIEQSRRRLDDLNVYPVPDGDTGTNLARTTGVIVGSLEQTDAQSRAELAQATMQAAVMGARENSGVILSQIVRGAVQTLATAEEIDAPAVAAAFRAAADAADRGVRRPVEGTMLTVMRELAAEAERKASAELPVAELLDELVEHGDDAVERTREQLDVLREAGVVDAGAAGLVELLRGLAASLAGRPARGERLLRLVSADE
jgi:dihydroxyacetone kinase-like predicted kinase